MSELEAIFTIASEIGRIKGLLEARDDEIKNLREQLAECEGLLKIANDEASALREAEAEAHTKLERLFEVLELCTPITDELAQVYDPVTAALVRSVCEARGYGNVMQAVAALWYAKDRIASFTVGPCAGTVRTALKGAVDAKNQG